MLTTRRQALKTLAATALASSALDQFSAFAQTPPATATPSKPVAPTGPFKLPPLPYAYDALEPHIDTETMHLHHDKHHAAYVAKLNEALAKEPSFAAGTNVDDLLKKFITEPPPVPSSIRGAVRNNGGGHSNHSLFWQTLSPKGGGEPKGDFAVAITADLGGFDKLKEDMSKAGMNLFGSGWSWLALRDKKLTLLTSPNQDSPFMYFRHYPLFGIDVWEHAYYLKYHNVRADYIKAIWNVVNWDFISDRYTTAMKA